MNAAAEAFSIRHVCGFGNDLPEGMASLDQALSRNPPTDARRHPGRPQGGDDLVRRNGGRLSPGTAHASEPDRRRTRAVARKRCAAGRNLMSAFAPSSFAGLTSSLWSGCCRAAHWRCIIPFDERRAGAADQRACLRHAGRAGATGVAAGRDRYAARLPRLRNVIGLWRAPEQVARARPGPPRHATLTDVYLFGEAGLFGARRGADDGAPAPILPGPHGAPRDVAGLVDRRRNLDDAEGHAWRCADRW